MNDSVDVAYKILKTILLSSGGEAKTIAEIDAAAQMVIHMELFNDCDKEKLYDGICTRYQENIGIKAFIAEVLTNGQENTSWFYKKKENIKTFYFDRYAEYLREEDFPEDSIVKIKKSTEEILSYCANPDNSIDIKNRKKKGLVIGDVQSGKTANYIALMNMAADYGYKVIVLLVGLTETLRVQTQKRIDSGFVGAISNTISSSEIQFIGVGLTDKKNYFSIPMTNIDKDFSKTNTHQNTTANDFTKPLVFVVKKNKSVLQQMKDWLKPEQVQFSSKNILIIDDEADNASVNSKSEENPSVINQLIRDLYNNFPTATYIGFTATPFANIFINPYDEDENKNLFPSDFIVQLKAPSNYFGLNLLFQKEKEEEDENYKCIRVLHEDEEFFVPVNHKKEDKVLEELPISLKEAIFDFLIANVIRTLRGREKSHRTMMINISRFNKIQETIYEKVNYYINNLRMAIEQTYKLSFEDFIKNEELNRLYNYYTNNDHYSKLREEYHWEKIQEGLYNEISQIMIEIMYDRSKNKFNYDEYQETGARVIVIGGFVLSRGLTLEGLMISYYSRNSNAYDTILQMCRWFGYRNGYLDLCRIYMSRINIDCFYAVKEAIVDLQEQFSRMKALGLTPKDYGLIVKESPDTLQTKMLITSRNKMRNSQEVIRPLNYSGRFVDTSKLYIEEEKNRKNLALLSKLVQILKEEGKFLQKYNKRFMFKDVSKEIIADFVKNLIIPIENKKFDRESLSEYIQNNKDFMFWDIVIATGEGNNVDEEWYFCNNTIPMVKRSFDVRAGENYIRISGNNNRLSEPGIFNSGLDEEQLIEAKRKAIERNEENVSIVAKDYLSVKNRKPLLVIYPLLLRAGGTLKEMEIASKYTKENVLLGFALGFPGIKTDDRVKYRMNLVKLNEMHSDIEEEEDIEEE